MKNILIVGCDYALSRRVATILAQRFDMRFFDVYDMFLFNNMPNSFADVFNASGTEYIDKKMHGIMKDETDFSNIVCVADLKVLSVSEDLFENIKENNVILFLKRDTQLEFEQRKNFAFKTEEERKYYTFALEELEKIKQKIDDNLATFSLEIDKLTYNEVRDDVYKKLVDLIK